MNLTFVVIGSCAEAGLKAKGSKKKAVRINAETQSLQVATGIGTQEPVAPSLLLPVALSLFIFIRIGADPTGELNRPLNSNLRSQTKESDRRSYLFWPTVSALP